MLTNHHKLLTNPYQQLSAWCFYQLHTLEFAERCLASIQAIEDKMLEYDRINKQHYPPDFKDTSPYNFWKNIGVDKFIHRGLTNYKERILPKRRDPSLLMTLSHGVAFNFSRYFCDVTMSTTCIPPGVDLNAPGELEELLTIADKLGSLPGSLFYFGTYLGWNLMGISDGLIRGDWVNVYFDARAMLAEPPVYPNYIIHIEPSYSTGDLFPRAGVWLPEHDYQEVIFGYVGYRTNKEFPLGIYRENKIQLGPAEYGLYDKELGEKIETLREPTRYFYVEEIPPNTPGIPNNPLRLEHLRVPPSRQNRRYQVVGGKPAPQGGEWFCVHWLDGPADKTITVNEGDILPAGRSATGEYVWLSKQGIADVQENYQSVVARYRKFYQDYLRHQNFDPAGMLNTD